MCWRCESSNHMLTRSRCQMLDQKDAARDALYGWFCSYDDAAFVIEATADERKSCCYFKPSQV